MRPVDKGDSPRIYKSYGDARDDLFDRIGMYCSYCEIKLTHMAEVEHIVPRDKGGKELEWENFLLSCKYCNTSKSNHNDSRNSYLWPDIDNTFIAFRYDKINQIKVNDELSQEEQIKAQNTIELLNLDRKPGKRGWNKSIKDTRYINIYEAWRKAEDLLNDYKEYQVPYLAKSIALNASSSGNFSIWMEVFKDYEEVKELIINEFKGTNNKYFEDMKAHA